MQDDAPSRPEDNGGQPESRPDSPTGSPADSKGGLQLYTKILIGLVAGSVVALICKSIAGDTGPFTQAALEEWGSRWMQPIGDFFIRAIILTVVPLVFASLTNGIYKLGDVRALGRMGGRTMIIFLGTAFLGAVLASGLYEVTQPGASLSDETRLLLAQQFQGKVTVAKGAADEAAKHFGGSLFEVLLSMVPGNIVEAMTSNRDLLKVILFSVLFGTALTMIERSKAEPVARFIEGLYEVMIKIITMLMALAPYGVFALVFMVIVRFGAEVLYALALYTVVVLLGLALHLIVILMPLVRILAKRSPLQFLAATRDIWITAFSTSSSSATLPTTMKVAEENLGVPKHVSSFVLPLGSTVNMDGTTIYQVIAVHFVAQVWGGTDRHYGLDHPHPRRHADGGRSGRRTGRRDSPALCRHGHGEHPGLGDPAGDRVDPRDGPRPGHVSFRPQRRRRHGHRVHRRRPRKRAGPRRQQQLNDTRIGAQRARRTCTLAGDRGGRDEKLDFVLWFGSRVRLQPLLGLRSGQRGRKLHQLRVRDHRVRDHHHHHGRWRRRRHHR